jgi:hypothetical protein
MKRNPMPVFVRLWGLPRLARRSQREWEELFILGG